MCLIENALLCLFSFKTKMKLHARQEWCISLNQLEILIDVSSMSKTDGFNRILVMINMQEENDFISVDS